VNVEATIEGVSSAATNIVDDLTGGTETRRIVGLIPPPVLMSAKGRDFSANLAEPSLI
jgi:hypothetical protein